jgi:hypothetical protein
MDYPHLLVPNFQEKFNLPLHGIVEIPKARPLFEKWTGESIPDTYNGKVILDSDGKPAFAELLILNTLKKDGWDGVWVDTYRNTYRTEYWPKNSVKLPPESEKLLNRIYEMAGSRKGCWDVFCWKKDSFIFAESKRRNHDKIRDTQISWLNAAFKCGLPLSSFLIVEWSEK